MSDPAADLAALIRRRVVEMTHRSGASHVGSGLSIAEILGVLYGGWLRVFPERPAALERDRFILSKGHACAALYAALAARGFFPEEWLDTFYQDGGRLFGHVTHHGVPGVDASAGSLGHGLPLAAGMALHAQRAGQAHRVVTVLSDGECDEGAVWEAALFAGHHRLDRLVAIVDYNGIQSMGPTAGILDLDPLVDKWRAFGWNAVEVDGHDVDAIRAALDAGMGGGRPSCVVARTVKGHGVSFMEDDVLWHYRAPDVDEYAAAVRELDA